MKKTLFLFSLLLVTILPTAISRAQSKTAVDTTDQYICVYRADMEKYCPGLLLDLEKRYGPNLGVNPESSSATHIAGMSREIGTAINESLESITNRSEQIAQTSVGKFTLTVIAYKVMGKSIVKLLVGLPILILILIIFIKWWAKIGVPYLRYKPQKENPNQYNCEIVYPGIGEQLLWGLVFLGVIWIAMGVIL